MNSPRNVKPEKPRVSAGDFETAWRRRFGEFAAARDDDAGIAGWSATGLDARVRKFMSLWDGGRTRQLWLDAGCGAGTYTRLLVSHGLQVVGIDYSHTTVAKADARDSGGALYAVGDLRRTPFRPKTFQGILCFGVTQALFSSDDLIRELTALVAPGGELWIDGLNRHCIVHVAEMIRRSLTHRPMHLRYESSAEIMRRLREAAFVDVKRYWMPMAPSRMPRLNRLFQHPLACGLLSAVPPLGAMASHSFIVYGRRPE